MRRFAYKTAINPSNTLFLLHFTIRHKSFPPFQDSTYTFMFSSVMNAWLHGMSMAVVACSAARMSHLLAVCSKTT